MTLARLLQQIEERKTHLVKVLPDFSTATRYIIPKTFTLNRERFVFEYFLLELDRIQPKNESETAALEKAQFGIRRMLLHLYTVHADLRMTDIPSLQAIHADLQRTAVRFFVDAATNNDFVLLEAAKKMGAGVNDQYCKESAIGEAAKHRHYAMAKHLIAEGADVNIVDGIVAKRTALDYAEKNADDEMQQLLHQAGANKQFHAFARQISQKQLVDAEPNKPVINYKTLESIRAFAADVDRMIGDLREQRDRQMFGGAAENKANNLAAALQRARAIITTFDSVNAFAEYKEDDKSSIKDALGMSVKMFGRAEAQQEAKNIIAMYSK